MNVTGPHARSASPDADKGTKAEIRAPHFQAFFFPGPPEYTSLGMLFIRGRVVRCASCSEGVEAEQSANKRDDGTLHNDNGVIET